MLVQHNALLSHPRPSLSLPASSIEWQAAFPSSVHRFTSKIVLVLLLFPYQRISSIPVNLARHYGIEHGTVWQPRAAYEWRKPAVDTQQAHEPAVGARLLQRSWTPLMERSESIDILLVNPHAEEIKLATLSFRDFFPGCHIEVVYRIEDALRWAQHAPWRLILLDEQLIELHPTSILPDLKRLAPFATVVLQSEGRMHTTALDALHTGADFLLNKKSPTFLAELMLYAKDVFEKQDARNAFEQLHGRHSQLIESLTDVLYELDSAGRFVYLSPSVSTMLGYSPEELVGTPYSTIIAPDQLDQARHRFDDRRTGTRASRNIHIELTPKSHPQEPHPARIQAEITAKGLYNSQRQHLGTRGLLRDISNQCDQEETIRRLTRQLQQTDQLIAAAQHLVSLSKELESPQASVLTQSQQLLDTIRDIRLIERMEALAHYAEEAARLGEAITRASADPAIHRHTINDVIESVLSSPPLVLMDGHQIERAYGKGLPPLTGLHDAAIRLMRILLSQALRYTMVTPTHRRLVIKTSAVTKDGQELPGNPSLPSSMVPVELKVQIETTNETIVGKCPLPLETGDLFEAYALLQQLGGRLDFFAPSSGRLSITIRIPVEPAPAGTTLSPQSNRSVLPNAPPEMSLIQTSPFPDRRRSPRILVQYPAHISIGSNTHVGTMTSLGQGGMDLLIDNMPASIENQPAYVVLQTGDTIVELQAVAHNRSSELHGSNSKPGLTRFALRFSPPINDKDRNTLSTLVIKAQTRALPMTVEILLVSETLPTLTSHVMADATRKGDHRETLRVRVKLPVHVHALSSQPIPQHSAGMVTNLSRGGGCLQLDQAPGTIGDRVTLNVSAPGQLSPIQPQNPQSNGALLSASIIWIAEAHASESRGASECSTPHWSVGVRFIQLTHLEEQEINRILAQHIISSSNVEGILDHSSFVHALWECRNDRQQVIAVTDTHLRHQISSNSPIVVIVPGYGRTHPDYLPLACYLAANSFRVLRYDHTNHVGLSDGEIVDISLGHMQTDLQSLLLFATTTWPTADITLVAEDVAARIALKTMALSCTADHLLLVDPVLDIRAALFSAYGRDVVDDFQHGLRRGVTNLWGLNVDLDSFISDTIVGQYIDWNTTAADFTIVSPTPIIVTTPERFRTAYQPSGSTDTHFTVTTLPVVALSGPIAGQSAYDDYHHNTAFHSIVRQISANIEERPQHSLMHTALRYNLAHRLLTEKERIRICHHISHADRDTLYTAYLTHLPQLQQMTGYEMVQAEFYQHLSPIAPGMTILDVGCEQSNFSKMLVSNHAYTATYRNWATDNPIHYIGLSQSQDVLATTQQQVDAFHNQLFASVSLDPSATHPLRTTWLVNDWGTSLPFEDHSIDRILFQLSLPFTRSPLQCLREAVRILRRDGMIVMISFRPHTDLTALIRHQIQAAKQDVVNPHTQSVLLFLGRLHEAIRHGILHSYEPEDLHDLCVQAGGSPLRILSVLENQLLLAIIRKS